jgi:uracil-DNA glycosylase family 4
LASLTPELREALAAQLEYYRDLGIFDFYQRAASGAMLVEIAEPVAASQIEIVEEPPIAARKSAPSLPIVNPTQDYSKIAGKGAEAMVQIREEIGDCTRCKLSVGRNKIVFGDGDPNARLMFVGEGPGADEDAQGLPFVGRAGQLLNNMINAMGLKREQVYIANIVKCRPPQNRVPEPDEAGTCMPFLEQQIAAVQPEIIIALGATAATYLLGAKSSLGSLRGKLHASRGAKLIVTYHPAFLLRDPRQKKEAWADLKIAMAELGLRAPSAPPA